MVEKIRNDAELMIKARELAILKLIAMPPMNKAKLMIDCEKTCLENEDLFDHVVDV